MLLWAANTLAADDCIVWQDNLASINGLVVGDISIQPSDLFDQSLQRENKYIHNLANRLHAATRPATISQALPLRTNDPFSLTTLNEAERILRSKSYIRSANVSAVQLCGNRVNINVVTIDNWTLTPTLSLGRAGGDNTYTFELQDLNIAGTGKQVKLATRRIGSRRASALAYRDENLLGSKYRLHFQLKDTTEGDGSFVNLGLPYHSISAPHFWTISASTNVQSYAEKLTQETNANIQTDTYAVGIGKRVPNKFNGVSRIGMGWRDSRQLSTLGSDGIQSSDLFDFDESYPFFTATYIRPKYLQRENYLDFGKVEDVSIGLGLTLETGFVSKQFGSSDNALRAAVRIIKGWGFGNKGVFTSDVRHIRYLGKGEFHKETTAIQFKYVHWITADDQMLFHLSADKTRGYAPIYTFDLGGESGLIGYPNSYQTGNNRVIGVAEYRHVFGWNIWNLVRAATTTFAEVGRAWSNHDNVPTISNFGIGLSFAPTRSSTTSVIRVDLAAPLVHAQDISRVQLYVGAQISY